MKNKKQKITIIWMNHESSFGNNGWGGFSGWLFGYKKEDGTVGAFAESLLDKYDEIFDIEWKTSFRNMIEKLKNK